MKRLFLEADELAQWHRPHGVHEQWQDHGMGILLTLAEQAGYPFDVLTLKAMHSWAELRMRLKGYDLLAMNVRSWRYIYAKRAAEIFKAVNPHGQVWVGGMHATVAPVEMGAVPEFDVIVKGRGERTWLDLLRHGPTRSGPLAPIIDGQGLANMDDLPWTNRELWPRTPDTTNWPLEGSGGWGPGKRALTMLSGFRCPFHCLTPDARVTMADGEAVPIVEVLPGSRVWGVNLQTGQKRLQLVKAVQRTSKARYDIMLVQVAGERSIRCTFDHRIYTRRGWVEAGRLTTADEVAIGSLYTHEERSVAGGMAARAHNLQAPRGKGQIQGMGRQAGVTAASVQRNESLMGNWQDHCCHESERCRPSASEQRENERTQPCSAIGGEREDSTNIAGSTRQVVAAGEGKWSRQERETAAITATQSRDQQPHARKQSDETPRSCCQSSCGNARETTDRPADLRATMDKGWHRTERSGESADLTCAAFRLPVCGGRFILDRPLPKRQMPQPGFHLQDGPQEDSTSAEWGILAHEETGAQRCRGNGRLCGPQLPCAGDLGQRIKGPSDGENQSARLANWARVISITPEPPSPVYDLEAHPDHNFFANGILVHNCSFCYPAEQNHFGPPSRRSVDNVIGEMVEARKRWGEFGTVVFHDSEFLMNLPWLERFLEAWPRAQGPAFWASCRADMIAKWPNLFEALIEQAGWHTVSIGLESGSQSVLDIMNKETTVEQNEAAIQLINEIGDRLAQQGKRPPVIFANVMLAIPGETREDAFETVRMLGRIKRCLPSISWMTPYPGSTLGDKLIAEGRSLDSHKKYLRFPNEAKISGVDYAFYVDLFNGGYDRETGVNMRELMSRQGSAVEALV